MASSRAPVYVEPYVLGSLYEPDVDVVDDLVGEIAVGVNVGYWRRLRLQLEGELWSVDRNTPIVLGQADRTTLIAQVGVSF